MSTHQPKAGLCMACAKRQHDCSGLPFATMPVLHTYSDGVTVVKCTSYERPQVKQTGSTLTKSNFKQKETEMTEAQEVPCKGKNCGRTDGEHSFECKEEASLCIGYADFSAALRALKEGYKVARRGWNGKGMWLVMVGSDGWTVPNKNYVSHPEFDGEPRLLPWIGMKTADNGFVPWLASQTDVLAEDWVIVE